MEQSLMNYCSQLSDLQIQTFRQEQIGLSTFDNLIFYLLQKMVATENSENYQIIIPDRNYQDDILSSVIICIALNKYVQNCNNYVFDNQLVRGDILYSYSTNTEFTFLNKRNEKYICQFRNAKKNQQGNSTSE